MEGVEVDGELAKRTLYDYRYNLTKHVLPVLGHLKLRDISTRAVKLFLRGKEPDYSKDSVRLMRAALSVTLQEAVEDGFIATNPAIWKGGRRNTKPKSDPNPMTWEQRERFLKAAYEFDAFYWVLFETMAKTGVRPGEAFALQIGDLDLPARKLRVERAVSMGEVKTTKTGKIRDIDLSRDLADLLESYVAQLKSEALRNRWELEWLFPSATNTRMDQSNVTKVYKRVLKKAGLPSFGFTICAIPMGAFSSTAAFRPRMFASRWDTPTPRPR